MQEFDFSAACEEGVKIGQQRLEESESFSSMFSSFCETYSNSLSAHTGENINVCESSNPLEELLCNSKRRQAATRFPFACTPIEGPEHEEISAFLRRGGKVIRKVKVFDCVKDRLTGFPCSIEYNGKSVLCNTKQELIEALKKIPAERSAYVIKGLGLIKRSV